MTTLKISLSFTDQPTHPNLSPGLHTIAEIMPAVLAAHGLVMPDDGDVEEQAHAGEARDLFNILLASVEEALAG